MSSVLAILVLPVILNNVAVEGQVSFSGDRQREALCTTPGGQHGACVDITTQLKFCPKLHGLLKKRDFAKLRQSICSEDNTRVCCPLEEFNENLTFDPEPNYSAHPNFRLFPLKDCGRSFTSDRILGGNVSLPGALPFMVRIGVKPIMDDGTPVQYICGGSLINRRYVLTAAHCFKSSAHQLAEIVLGQTDERKKQECIQVTGSNGKLMDVSCGTPIRVGYDKVILHPGYTKQVGSGHDIALIRLSREVNITTPFASPICLPFLNEYYVKDSLGESKILRKEDSMVAGWGKTNNVEVIGSSTLQFVRVPVQPHILCRISYRTLNVTEKQVCAGGVKGQDSCLGDSGGPLYIPATPDKQAPTRTQRMFQLGVVSFGKTKCGKGNEPVVYTRVRSYLKWILDNVRE